MLINDKNASRLFRLIKAQNRLCLYQGIHSYPQGLPYTITRHNYDVRMYRVSERIRLINFRINEIVTITEEWNKIEEIRSKHAE